MDQSASPVIVLSLQGVRKGMIAFIPVCLFILPFGLAFGATAVEVGMSADHALLMSALHFSGAAQFAALDLWHQPLPLVTLVLTIFAANARHILMGAALAPWLNRLPLWERWLAMCFTSDPNFGDTMVRLRTEPLDAGRLLGNGITMWIAWVAGSGIGAYAGQALGDLSVFGLDVVILALFSGLLVKQWEGKPDVLPALAAAVTAIAGLYWLPPGWNIVVAALAGGLIGGLMTSNDGSEHSDVR
ncbi:AzlC family ABC transporter permease [Coralliovum pocilloporae]|uniref:AzlC family ABC transporter permease n=1 Tax=Coralliovum pocilloporae TaxID=3066369 RepID=UPI003306DF85